MELKVGGVYKTRDGRKVRVLCLDKLTKMNDPVLGLVTSTQYGTENTIRFRSNGTGFGFEGQSDLVSEWQEPASIKSGSAIAALLNDELLAHDAAVRKLQTETMHDVFLRINRELEASISTLLYVPHEAVRNAQPDKMYVRGDITAKAKQCNHKDVKYTGMHEVYEYCIHCDRKKV